jgi:4-hydroxy-2-oxoheptanedioate aldolase
MMIAENAAKKKLKAGEPIFVGVLNFRHPALAEFLGHNGFDVIMMDGEHNALDEASIEECAVATKYAGACPILRIPPDPHAVMRFMDMGIMGLHIPQISSVKEVRGVVEAMKYPPVGSRGVAGNRATRYSLRGEEWAPYTRKANAETILICAIESMEGMRALPQIVKIPEIDALELGNNDLANYLGVTGQLDHPKVLAQVKKFKDLANEAGKPYGIGANNSPAQMRANYEAGSRWLITSSSRMLRTIAEEFQGGVKAAQAERGTASGNGRPAKADRKATTRR